MRKIRFNAAGRVLVFATLLFPLVAISGQPDDRTLSPYFQIVTENNESGETLPLQSTQVDARIAGVIADVRVTQVYRNRGNVPIDAIYVFPGSTKAAVYGMRMRIGERVVKAKIKERAAARATFNRAKSEGKRVSLLEQQRPNVFQMNVANIMPGDTVAVELRYTEIIVPEQGTYEFVYPAVVGPRYSETPVANAPDTVAWVANPYLPEGHNSSHLFDIEVSLSTGIPIQGIQSSSHDVHVSFESKGRAQVGLIGNSVDAVNRDYILQYQLQGNQVESGLLLHEGEGENYFLLMTQPPRRVKPEQIPPREYIFVVDVSGSMHGFPLDTGKQLMTELLGGLKATDRFNILFFSGGASLLAESSLPATAENIQNAVEFMENIQGGGGTRLLPALQRAMALISEPGTARSFVVVTDGFVSVEVEAFEFVRENLDQASFFAFGIGSSVNRYLIEGLARAGRGEPFIMTSPDQARLLAKRFKEYIETPVLTGIEIEFGEFDAFEIQPGHAPDLFAERPLVVFGKWRGEARGVIRVLGHHGESVVEQTLNVEIDAVSKGNDALRYLWARQRISDLGDYHRLSPDSEFREEMTSLGLAYNLLTAYTSFIAVDELIINADGNSQAVKQPLPLPAGVSNLAVGGMVPTTPEPEILFLILVSALLLLCFVSLRRYQAIVSQTPGVR